MSPVFSNSPCPTPTQLSSQVQQLVQLANTLQDLVASCCRQQQQQNRTRSAGGQLATLLAHSLIEGLVQLELQLSPGCGSSTSTSTAAAAAAGRRTLSGMAAASGAASRAVGRDAEDLLQQCKAFLSQEKQQQQQAHVAQEADQLRQQIAQQTALEEAKQRLQEERQQIQQQVRWVVWKVCDCV